MSEYDDKLEVWANECSDIVTKVQESTEDTILENVEQFQRNTLDNIQQQFGDFLYTALGDRVTGQRSSTLNTTFFEESTEGKKIAEKAEEEGVTIEEYLIAQAKNRYGSQPWIQPYITCGRKFGVSYLTGNAGRTQTIYFGSGNCFEYLTQEHVDCIKNRLKRECAQDFLNFRNDFVDGIERLNNVMIPTPVDIELGVMSCIEKSAKINRHGGSYNDQSLKRFTIMDGIIGGRITHTLVRMQDVSVWNKRSEVMRGVKNERSRTPSFISLVFYDIDDTAKKLTVMGNMDMSLNVVKHSLSKIGEFNMRTNLNRIDEVNQYRASQSKALDLYQTYKSLDCGGMVMSMDKIINDPAVNAVWTERIKFYNDMSDRLQKMKHQHATLYFVNADL
jgi:hypothetical protein